jgi:SAM-dependent methyltransferase
MTFHLESPKNIDEHGCLACNSPKFSRWFTKTSATDDLRYPISKCAECRSAFVVPRPTFEYLEAYYTGSGQSHAKSIELDTDTEAYEKILRDEENFPNSGVDATRIASHCRVLASGNKFLDIGAGYGFFSRAALRCGFQVTAIEPTKECRDVFRLMCGAEPLPGMLTSNFVRANRESFDVVLMSQVLEHITDLETTLGYLRDLLAPGGIITIAVPHFGSWLSRLQGKGDMFIGPPEHVNLFSKTGLRALFERHGFACCDIHTISRINIGRVRKRIGIPFLGGTVARCALGMVKLSDHFQGGMFINAYFSKSGAANSAPPAPLRGRE